MLKQAHLLESSMLQATKSTAAWMLSSVFWRLSKPYELLALRLIYRLGRRRLFETLPATYVLATLLQVISISVLYGSLLFVCIRCGWIVGTGLLAGCVLVRLRYGVPVTAIGIGILRITVAPQLSASVVALAAACWGIGAVVFSERRHARRQFAFKPFFLSNVNEGSAKVLEGTVDVVHLFAGDALRWPKSKRQAVHTRLATALSWLRSEASRYKVNLEFCQHHVVIDEEDGAVGVPDSADPPDRHEEFARHLSERLPNRFGREMQGEGRNACLVVHVQHQLNGCLGYAVPKRRNRDCVCPLEYIVVGPPYEAAVYAHELLHLFGADDFYMAAYHGSGHHEAADRAKLLDRCIMFQAHDPLVKLRVDDLTAQNVGWL